MLYSYVLTAVFVLASTSNGAPLKVRQTPAVALESPDLPGQGGSISGAAAAILGGAAPAGEIDFRRVVIWIE